LFEKIKKSKFWLTRNECISGRFDFALNKQGLKAYEYNVDSASCLMESGYSTELWSKALGISNLGSNSCDKIHSRLVSTWKKRNIVGALHFMCDNNGEEIYHTL